MDNNLYILWTNADRNTSINMVMMYAENSLIHEWWDSVVVIIWGATVKYVAEDKEIQSIISRLQTRGVQFEACIACARNNGVIDQLLELGIDVRSEGLPLTSIIKNGDNLITI